MPEAPTRSRRERIREDVAWLARAFPRLFRAPDDDRRRKPSKIGIQRDITDMGLIGPDGEEFSRTRIDEALSYYTRDFKYHTALTKMAKRYDLDGQLAGVVSDAARAHALRTLQARAKRTGRRRRPAGRTRRNDAQPTAA
jgi:sRNA-binding protein